MLMNMHTICGWFVGYGYFVSAKVIFTHIVQGCFTGTKMFVCSATEVILKNIN